LPGADVVLGAAGVFMFGFTYLYVGINNLASQNYIGTVRLNALGGRYFEPAPTLNSYAGIAVIARL